jgi:hypothetical protein
VTACESSIVNWRVILVISLQLHWNTLIKTRKKKGGPMSRPKENGLVLEEKDGMIHLVLNLTIARRVLWTLLILLALALIAMGSSLNQDARKAIMDFLIGALQFLLFTRWRPKS